MCSDSFLRIRAGVVKTPLRQRFEFGTQSADGSGCVSDSKGPRWKRSHPRRCAPPGRGERSLIFPFGLRQTKKIKTTYKMDADEEAGQSPKYRDPASTLDHDWTGSTLPPVFICVHLRPSCGSSPLLGCGSAALRSPRLCAKKFVSPAFGNHPLCQKNAPSLPRA